MGSLGNGKPDCICVSSRYIQNNLLQFLGHNPEVEVRFFHSPLRSFDQFYISFAIHYIITLLLQLADSRRKNSSCGTPKGIIKTGIGVVLVKLVYYLIGRYSCQLVKVTVYNGMAFRQTFHGEVVKLVIYFE